MLFRLHPALTSRAFFFVVRMLNPAEGFGRPSRVFSVRPEFQRRSAGKIGIPGFPLPVAVCCIWGKKLAYNNDAPIFDSSKLLWSQNYPTYDILINSNLIFCFDLTMIHI
jgi:hypothetical protein